ncbi:acyl-CoA thioesterase [Sphingomonas sp. BN140010]|uniref:Acyl-CoA thioesterase n=1 Tax=Sphingomonas arvum TaxID=2992113 RepID=A0ABT3JEL1_9SPHN|nr:thioesterase family protein [Sphingomonas sp. BN140010]MCW3797359.1 acyl-CoA thioesterase [Sphingomonas sp. BN140010]
MSRPTAPIRADFRHWQRFTTRWADNDAYGHVNNTVYYQWFDSAVNAWLVGQGLLNIVAGDPIALVVETRCSYFAGLEFPGDVEVGLAIAELGRSSVRYRIGVFAPAHDHPAAAGEFVHVAVERAGRRPTPWPEAWRAAFATIS